MFFCSIAKGKDVLFSYNGGGDDELEKLASSLQEKAPAHHAWYSHTEKQRTSGFLFEDGYVYFSIYEGKDNLENLQFLKKLRGCFMKVRKKKEFHGELSSAVRRMTSSDGTYQPPLTLAGHAINGGAGESVGGLTRTSSAKARALEKNLKKNKDRSVEVGKDTLDAGLKTDVAQEHVGIPISLRRNSSLKARSQQHAQRLWWCHVKIVAAIDVLLCLGLFVAWLVVCRGFQCLSS